MTWLCVCLPASVSKPAVSQMCLSPDLMNVSCSSEGDAVEFTLTLDGHFLLQTEGRSLSQSSGTINDQTEDRSGVSSVTISLYGQLTGHLECHVENNVSRDETVVHLTRCEGKVYKGHLSSLIRSYFTFYLNIFKHITFTHSFSVGVRFDIWYVLNTRQN